jgi:uncharacterized RDD family membrane protein YckC/Flp pilus assembly protein TadD
MEKASKVELNSKSQYANFGRRLAANIIDFLILILIIKGIGSSLNLNLLFIEVTQTNDLFARVLGFLIPLAFSVLFWVNFEGATPGKRFLGIKVVKESGEALNYPTALIRYIGYCISAIPLFFGYLWMLWDKKRQTWHDKLAKTVVIKTEKQINQLLILLLTILGFIISTGVLVGPYALEEIKKLQYKKERQEKYVETMKKYSEEVGKLDAEAEVFIKSALAKIQKANELAGKTDITESEKEQVKILLAEAIKEAKKASDLNPQNHVTWVQLGNIYRNLIGPVEGAGDWAIKSYQKAISLDPNNYLYHEMLGGVYFKIEKYEQAIEEFRKVTELSPSYANGYYNLGVAYKKYGAKTRAKEALEKALELLPSDDPDRYKAEKELETL